MREWVDHTSELELHAEAGSREGVFTEATEALAELLGDVEAGEPVRRRIAVTAADDAALLAEWLGELAWLAEGEGLIAQRVVELRAGAGTAEGTVEARPGRARHLVKAVTYHRLACEARDGGWHATVVFDV